MNVNPWIFGASNLCTFGAYFISIRMFRLSRRTGRVLKSQNALIQLQQETLESQNKLILSQQENIRLLSEESAQPLAEGQYLIGTCMNGDTDKHHSFIQHPDGSRYMGPARDTWDEALADCKDKRAEVEKRMGGAATFFEPNANRLVH